MSAGVTAGDASRQVQYPPDDLVDGCNKQPLPLLQWTQDKNSSGVERCGDVGRRLPAKLEHPPARTRSQGPPTPVSLSKLPINKLFGYYAHIQRQRRSLKVIRSRERVVDHGRI